MTPRVAKRQTVRRLRGARRTLHSPKPALEVKKSRRRSVGRGRRGGAILLISGREGEAGGGSAGPSSLLESRAPPPPHTQDIHTHSHTVAAGHAHPAPAAGAYTRRWRHSPELVPRAPATLGAAERRPGPGRGPEWGKQERPQRRPGIRGDGAFSLIPFLQYLGPPTHPAHGPRRSRERQAPGRGTHAGARFAARSPRGARLSPGRKLARS